MPLTPDRAVEQARLLYGYHIAEREMLDAVRRYWKGRQALPAIIPTSAPNEVRVMARSSRVNVLEIVVNSLVQSAFVDGFRAAGSSDDLEVWNVWQKNRMDARQTGIHRAAAAYGTAYATILPGDTAPVIRGASPRTLCTLYGEDPDWPLWALQKLGNGLWRLFDDEAVYYVEIDEKERDLATGKRKTEFISRADHNLGVCPVVRYLDEEDLDADDEVELERRSLGEVDTLTRGQVAPLMALQDQIDLTTFGLQVAQHFGAFRQRYVIGWVAESEAEAVKMNASRLLTFDAPPDGPEGIKLGEFEETNLTGYIESREATLRHAATLSQTPVHELTGQLVNMAAEALAAAEAGKDRKVHERQIVWGESHEQTNWAVGQYMGIDVPDDAEIHWEDLTARSFAAVVDALGKVAQMLGVPADELWERIPGVTQADVDRWREAKKNGRPPVPVAPVKPAIPTLPMA